MRAWSVVTLLLLRSAVVCGSAVMTQSPPKVLYLSPRISTLARELDSGDKNALKTFWREIQGHAPIIEPDADDSRMRLLTYLWRGSTNTKSVGVLGDVPIDGNYTLQRFRDTDLWFRTERLPKDARFGYELCDGSCMRDPLNPAWWDSIGRSVVEMPDAPPEPWIVAAPNTPKGSLVKAIIKSSILGEDRPVGVYTPPGYSLEKGPYNLLIVFDGDGYGIDPNSPEPTPTILDNLLSKDKVSPTVAVLVSNIDGSKRNRDLSCSVRFEDFLAKELVPWAVQYYHAADDPSRVVVAGSSLGGLSASCTALRHPETFGNVLSQSGTYTYSPDENAGAKNYFLGENNWLARKFASEPLLPIRFFVSVGRLEGGSAWSGLLENRRLRDVLIAKGNQVSYWEYTGSHDALTWRDSLADGLIALLGPERLQWLQ